jgi:hypothetical protein
MVFINTAKGAAVTSANLPSVNQCKNTLKKRRKWPKKKGNKLEKLNGKNIVVYDTEIKNVVDGIKVTWGTKNLMGISVACLFDYLTGDYQVYFDKDVEQLAHRLNAADLVVGFNTTGFDNDVVRSNGGKSLWDDEKLKNWDILEHSRRSTGWTPKDRFPSGMKLDDHLEATFGEQFMKTADGADAPLMFQRGEIGKLTSYCLADVRREKTLFEHIVQHGWVKTKMHGQKHIDLSLINRALGQ